MERALDYREVVYHHIVWRFDVIACGAVRVDAYTPIRWIAPILRAGFGVITGAGWR
jgi:hypothetical protein